MRCNSFDDGRHLSRTLSWYDARWEQRILESGKVGSATRPVLSAPSSVYPPGKASAKALQSIEGEIQLPNERAYGARRAAARRSAAVSPIGAL